MPTEDDAVEEDRYDHARSWMSPLGADGTFYLAGESDMAAEDYFISAMDACLEGRDR